ncbi:hypothetical protein EYF80_058877 [Liparis tanakae]|uniref:Uncharacterized protein n=1 Tax=Liparis tanakae TaxID=230148 RepID=A0A4Z2EQX5_9TELE|nr:hypothetical protein EYF80_058877 [Liparis tanakae]
MELASKYICQTDLRWSPGRHASPAEHPREKKDAERRRSTFPPAGQHAHKQPGGSHRVARLSGSLKLHNREVKRQEEEEEEEEEEKQRGVQ